MIDIDISLQRSAFSLEIAAQCPGGCTVIFGPSGAGKTSVARVIAGLETRATGRIAIGPNVVLDSTNGINLPPLARQIGYVFQEPRLFPHLTVRQNLLYGAPKGSNPKGAAELLDILSLLDRRPGALSGGEAQRVALGRALMRAPHLLILDEPLAALDQARKHAILPYLRRLRDEAGVPMIYITHAIEEVLHLGTTLMLLRDGRLRQLGPVAEILADPTAARDLGPRLAGAVLPGLLGAEHEGLSEITTPAGAIFVPTPALKPGTAIQLRIMAQDIILATNRPEGISALNVLSGHVVEIRDGDGPGVMVKVDAGGANLLARITKRSARTLGLAPGKPIYAILKTVSIAPGNLVTQTPGTGGRRDKSRPTRPNN